MLFVHAGARHCLVWPGMVQLCVLVPSQKPSHPVPSPGHTARGAFGDPVTGEQVPFEAVRLHASH